jgi:hypothetical protein
LQFGYRRGNSIGGERRIVDYDPATGTWKNNRAIDSPKGLFKDEHREGVSNSRCSYPNGYHYDPKGNLHTTWVWRERNGGPNRDLMYMYSPDQGTTWLNNAGEVLDGPAHTDSPGLKVVDISRAYGLMNDQAQAVDSAGRIHAVMWHCSDASLEAATQRNRTSWRPVDARRYHHYWRDEKGAWQHRELPGIAGNRPKLFFDKQDNAYLIFARQADPDKRMKQDIYFSEGHLVIMAASAKSAWTDWQDIHIEKDLFGNEMLGDIYRWKESGILSVLVQESPTGERESTPLRILDFAFGQE